MGRLPSQRRRGRAGTARDISARSNCRTLSEACQPNICSRALRAGERCRHNSSRRLLHAGALHRFGDMIPAMSEGPSRVTTRSWQESAGRLAVLWLVFVLTVVTFETGRHSAHHLDDDDAAACVVAAVTGELSIVEAPPVTPMVFEVVGFVVPDAVPSDSPTRPPAVHRGRAPPLSLSA